MTMTFCMYPMNRTIHLTPPHRTIIAASLWMAVVCNLPLWQTLLSLSPGHQLRSLWFTLVFAIVVAAGNTALLSLLGWRKVLKPSAAILIATAAAGAYFIQAYGIQIDANMIINTLQTDVHEAGDLINLKMILSVCAMTLPAWWWLYRQPLQHPPALRALMHNGALLLGAVLIIVACILLTFQQFSSTMRNHTQLRYMINPLNTAYGLANVATQPLRMKSKVIMPLGQDAHLGKSYTATSKPPLIVLVLGETGRAGNFGLNGYARGTTPHLSARQDILTASNAWSCGTSTAASVPCMYSHLGKGDFESRTTESEGLLDVLSHAGLAVVWVDNQSGCKGVCDRVTHVDAHQNNPACTDSDCLDVTMLGKLNEYWSQLPAEQKAKGTVMVLHQMGSHGPAYFKRSAPERKKIAPECQSTSLQDCSQADVINAYDNSIVETDYFLNKVIEWTSQHQDTASTAVMYVSDHGESLGENNLYLHGLPYAFAPDVQKHIPWIWWLSPDMQQRLGTDRLCLQQKLASERITHDSYFHTVLGMADIQTSVYQPALDILKSCQSLKAS